ncbi:unnamed protein product [Chrysoparadoxa australica]
MVSVDGASLADSSGFSCSSASVITANLEEDGKAREKVEGGGGEEEELQAEMLQESGDDDDDDDEEEEEYMLIPKGGLRPSYERRFTVHDAELLAVGTDVAEKEKKDSDSDLSQPSAKEGLAKEAEVPKAAAPTSPRPSSIKKARVRPDPNVIVLNTARCEYKVVREMALEMGWEVCETKFSTSSSEPAYKERTSNHTTGDGSYACTHSGLCTPHWNVLWHDHINFGDYFKGLLPFQRFNHLPGLAFFAKKAGLATMMRRMFMAAPDEFRFYPRTWILPMEMNDFKTEFVRGSSSSVYIIKPDCGSQGRGIFLTKKLEPVIEMTEKAVAQKYLTNPLLIEGYKFDLRLYVLVTSVDPLQIYLFDDGLVRMCTEPFQGAKKGNIENSFMHLTNYSVNKGSSKFTKDGEQGESGFKRSLKWFKTWLTEQGHDSDAVWRGLADTCAKTIITVSPKLRREYRCWNVSPGPSTCWTIIGMDIMLDDKLDPWIIEINHLPSFRTETPMDTDIKGRLVKDTLRLLGVQSQDRADWQKAKQRKDRERLLGLPPKEPSGSPAGTTRKRKGGSATQLSPECKASGAGSSREGGFERICPPSSTAPNAGVDYTPVADIAESVFLRLSGLSQGPTLLTPPRTPQRSPRPSSPARSDLSPPRLRSISPKPSKSSKHRDKGKSSKKKKKKKKKSLSSPARSPAHGKVNAGRTRGGVPSDSGDRMVLPLSQGRLLARDEDDPELYFMNGGEFLGLVEGYNQDTRAQQQHQHQQAAARAWPGQSYRQVPGRRGSGPPPASSRAAPGAPGMQIFSLGGTSTQAAAGGHAAEEFRIGRPATTGTRTRHYSNTVNPAGVLLGKQASSPTPPAGALQGGGRGRAQILPPGTVVHSLRIGNSNSNSNGNGNSGSGMRGGGLAHSCSNAAAKPTNFNAYIRELVKQQPTPGPAGLRQGRKPSPAAKPFTASNVVISIGGKSGTRQRSI